MGYAFAFTGYHIRFACAARRLPEKPGLSVMFTFIATFMATWALGYVLGFKVRMIKAALNAA